MVFYLNIFLLVLLWGICMVMFLKLRRAYRLFAVKKSTPSSGELPSISICITARNEMHALAECLERVLKSDYKKMEIIVLDDNSDDKTSVIIRSFAHAGVRFIQGDSLPSGWLGRNFAIDRLSREASGELIVYLDVDTFIRPDTISQLVRYATGNSLDMVSVIPGKISGRLSAIFGTLRYYEELLLASQTRPAVSASLWVLNRNTLLNEMGGIKSFADKILLELAMATRLGNTRYHTLLNNSQLGVYFEKRLSTQYESARRILYPLLADSSPIKISGVILCMVLSALAPIFMVVVFLGGYYVLSMGYFLVQLLFVVLYASYIRRTWLTRAWILAVFFWPPILIQETILLCQSYIGYIRGTITWKGRSVGSNPKG